MKVYVIEKGIYSDRRVIGVVETKEEAEAVVNAIKSNDDDSVTYEEYDTHQFKTSLLFHVEYICGDWHVNYYDWERVDKSVETYEDNWIVLAKNRNQAIKIAQDMRARRLAKEKGIN